MKFKLLWLFLLSYCLSDRIVFSMQSNAVPNQEEWAKDTNLMYGIIDTYNKNNGTVSFADQQEFRQTLDILEQEINALNPKKYDVAKYKKDYLNSYKEWEPYILVGYQDNEEKAQDLAAKKVAASTAVQKKQDATKKITQDKVDIEAAEKFDAEQKILANKKSSKAQSKVLYKSLSEEKWIQKALILYEIIDGYSQRGYVSTDDQEQYSQILDDMEREISALDPKEYNVAEYKSIYVTPYKEWESFIVQEISDIKEPSQEELQIEANAAKAQEIFGDVEHKILMYCDEFLQDVEALLSDLGDYSVENKNNLYKNLESEVDTFKSYMKTIKINAINSYFSYVKDHGQTVDALHLTPDQHALVFGVGVMIERATIHVEGIVLDLTTNMTAAAFANQAADAFDQYEKQTEVDYQAVLEANRKLGDKNVWDGLKHSGSRIMKNFGGKMEEAVKKQAAEQVQKVLEEKGADLAQAVGKKAGEIGGVALAHIKSTASNMGGAAFDKLKERAQALGGETFTKFTDKVTDLGGDALKMLKDKTGDIGKTVSGFVVDQVKELASNQIGVDIDALAELLSGKGISPEALRKAIIKRYPVPTAQQETVVKVQEGSELCAQEKAYLINRSKLVEKTLKDDFGITSVEGKPLRLAFACSGGGNRAMIGTLGMLQAAARNKFLDASMYVTGLSGSTWTIAPWSYMYLKGLLTDETEECLQNPLEYSLQQFKEMLINELDYACPLPTCPAGIYPPDMLASDIKMAFSNNLAKHFAYDQQITAVDLWGALVSNYALKKVGSSRLNVTWSSMAQDVQKGLIPLPLCSSVFDLKDRTSDQTGYRAEYKWFESGPFEAGSTLLGFIPVWALGSTFEGGKIVSHAPEYEMSEFLGVYGSAFAVSVNDLVDKGIPLPSFTIAGVEIKLPVDSWMRSLIDGVDADIRAQRSQHVHAQFANFSKGLEKSALKDQDQFGMFDGGMYFNIPLPLLFDRSQRAVDVVIMYDSNPVDMQCLVDASRYFAKNGVAVPDMQIDPVTGKSISQAGLLSRLMTVFNDPRNVRTYNPKQPTLIYFPTPKTDISKPPYNLDHDDFEPIDGSKPPYTTANFKYTAAEFENLAQTMGAIFDSQVDAMKEILHRVSDKRLGVE